jgi:hypothetical protein
VLVRSDPQALTSARMTRVSSSPVFSSRS